ncbi:MAG: DedA family protein [Alphaproteobacteria bacterium]|nr:DedA family protein [Alphaproteobacteria bacterium]
MHDIRLLIHHHGDLIYLITFLWTVLEGETFVIFAGLAAQKGMLNVWLLFLASWSGSFCGDQFFFFLGRRYGLRILDHLPKMKPAIDRSLGWLERHAAAFILAYRFMYGVRNISGLAIGMSHLSARKFMYWNALAAFIWAAAFTGFGFLFGDVIAHMHHKNTVVEGSVRQITLSMLGLFLLIVCFRLLVVWYQNRKKK